MWVEVSCGSKRVGVKLGETVVVVAIAGWREAVIR